MSYFLCIHSQRCTFLNSHSHLKMIMHPRQTRKPSQTLSVVNHLNHKMQPPIRNNQRILPIHRKRIDYNQQHQVPSHGSLTRIRKPCRWDGGLNTRANARACRPQDFQVRHTSRYRVTDFNLKCVSEDLVVSDVAAWSCGARCCYLDQRLRGLLVVLGSVDVHCVWVHGSLDRV